MEVRTTRTVYAEYTLNMAYNPNLIKIECGSVGRYIKDYKDMLGTRVYVIQFDIDNGRVFGHINNNSFEQIGCEPL